MKRVWKSFILVLTLLVAFGMISSFAMAASPIKVQIDGKALQMEVPPREINGRVMVPLRSIFEALNIDVDYGQGVVLATKGFWYMTMEVGNKKITCTSNPNGYFISKVAPMEINGYVYVPLRDIAQSFGCSVFWDAELRKVAITNSIFAKPYLPGYVSLKTIDLTGVPNYSDLPIPDFGKAVDYSGEVISDSSGWRWYNGALVQQADIIAYFEALKKQGYVFAYQYVNPELGDHESLAVRIADNVIRIDMNPTDSLDYRYGVIVYNAAK